MTMKLFQSLKIKRRNDVPVEELEPVSCDNCKYMFKGHYCPNCGQEVAEFNRPFGFILYDFAGNFFAFDTRFFMTFKYLLLKPGFLAVEFFKGRRASYSPPFRSFVFLSFVLFILLQVLTEKSLDSSASIDVESLSEDSVSASISSEEIRKEIQSEIEISGTGNLVSLTGNEAPEKELPDIQQTQDLDFSIFAKGSIRDNLYKLADQLEAKTLQTKDASMRKRYQTYIAMCRTPEIVISQFMKYLSWMFFILLPVYALILKLFYIRRHQLYIRHLIFSIYLHSYLFFILIIVTSLKLLSVPVLSYVSGMLLLSLLLYYIIAFKRFYGQSYGKVILKFTGIHLLYLLIILTSVLYILILSLALV